MKTLLTLASFALIVSASAQTTEAPKPMPMAAPAMKVQNTQNSQNSTAPKSTSGTTDTKTSGTETKKAAPDKSAEAAPPVDNKIAVSDPGASGDNKSNTKKADTKSAEKKAAPTSGVSPK